MSFFEIIETILIGPLKLVFEIIYMLAYRIVGDPGLSIIFLSLVMNILVLPLYRRADAMQEEARDMDAKLHDGVTHIKKTFSGDERMMILQAYYRQNNYKPTDALRGSVSLLLEIPFFMAAYQFLSHLTILDGVAFGPIANLGAPDGLLVIGGLSINLLPILMTLINVISSALYLKGFPLKTKVQLYGMALFFLVFLYGSPACLVFYWTLNNVFSLVKTIFYKLKNPRKVLLILTTLLGVAVMAFGVFLYHPVSMRRKLFVVGIGVMLLVPAVLTALKSRLPKGHGAEPVPNGKLFMLCAVLMTVLVGLLIPSTVLAASPQEFIDATYFYNPLWYLVSSGCLAAGTFLVWLRVFYWLAADRGKVIFEHGAWVACGLMLINYMFFGTDRGILSPSLTYENLLRFTMQEQLLNLLVMGVAAVVLLVISVKGRKAVGMAVLTVSIALGVMTVSNVVTVKKSVDSVTVQSADVEPGFTLSTTGQNVVVLMLDRAMGEYLPFILNEQPQLKQQLEGFTYYSNVISHGEYTNFGAPGLFGGYEYTPMEMNRRDDLTLSEKHNEALLLMPTLFSQAGYEVTVLDPPYANYQWIPDLGLYEELPNVTAYITDGVFSDAAPKQGAIDNRKRNFFCFGLMKTLPLAVQPTLYNDGLYNQSAATDEESYPLQDIKSAHVAEGISSYFMGSYASLCNLTEMTTVTDAPANTLLLMDNETPHRPALLQMPNYEVAYAVDNTAYEAENSDRFILDGQQLHVSAAHQMAHYHANVASLLRVGQWLDDLRELGVYDNTRIIIVSDHAAGFDQLDALIHEDGMDVSCVFPLLLVKDFNSTEFSVSDSFMTNADVPVLAMDGIIDNPVNPFTGVAITDAQKHAHEQYVALGGSWDVLENNGNTFEPCQWASVKDDLWVEDNWTFYEGEFVLKEPMKP